MKNFTIHYIENGELKTYEAKRVRCEIEALAEFKSVVKTKTFVTKVEEHKL